MTGDLQHPPIVLTQSRAALAPAVVLGLVALVMGLTIAPGHWMVDGLFPAEWLLVPGGAAFLMAGLYALARPGRLSLSPAGVEYRLLLWTRNAPWSAVSKVGRWSYRGAERGVSLSLASGRTWNLASGWPIDTATLAALVAEARQQWRDGSAAAAVPPPTWSAPERAPTVTPGRFWRGA